MQSKAYAAMKERQSERRGEGERMSIFRQETAAAHAAASDHSQILLR